MDLGNLMRSMPREMIELLKGETVSFARMKELIIKAHLDITEEDKAFIRQRDEWARLLEESSERFQDIANKYLSNLTDEEGEELDKFMMGLEHGITPNDFEEDALTVTKMIEWVEEYQAQQSL